MPSVLACLCSERLVVVLSRLRRRLGTGLRWGGLPTGRSSRDSYYATKAARSGRRSYYTGRSDVLSPGCQIDGKARHDWLDDEVEFESGDSGTLHDVIASSGYQGRETDPAEEAARNLDWESFLASHPARHRAAIGVLVKGGTMREAGKRCGPQGQRRQNPQAPDLRLMCVSLASGQ